jgi:microcin C transport system ATP-binding protein
LPWRWPTTPELLIADEPTTALDVTVQAQILELLKDLQREFGMAIILITHDLGVVRHVADHVCVMKHGEIVESGKTSQLFFKPQHEYTKMLLGAEPKGRPPKADPKPRLVVQTDNLKVWFPIKRGFFRKTVGHVKACNDVSITVRAGQTLGVVGESGSGKTTLGLAILRLISRKARSSTWATGWTATPRSRCARCGARCRWCSRTRTDRYPLACRSARSSRKAC